MGARLAINHDEIVAFCQRHHIRKLALFRTRFSKCVGELSGRSATLADVASFRQIAGAARALKRTANIV